jgi:hypothetical protein
MQTRHSANHRRVKRAPGETESYEADFNHGVHLSRKANAKSIEVSNSTQKDFPETRSCLKAQCPSE